MTYDRTRRSAVIAIVLLLLTAVGASAAPPAQRAVELQFLAVSDWHGQVTPLDVFGVGDVGGAAALSTYFQQDRAANPNTLTLTAGDAFGASPPLSSFFDEEPAVLSMNLMGLDADTFGNHNFDRGISHLQQMIELADFQYVSANLANRDDNLSGVQDYELFDVGGVTVAVIGLTNPEAPELVFPGSFGTIEVTDPVRAARRARAAARRDGADMFVVIAHMGVRGFDAETGEPFGELIDLARSLRGFDLILGDHTDVQFEGVINNQLVIENRSKGLTYSRTELVVDPRSGRVLSHDNEFITPLSDAVEPDPQVVQLLAPYQAELAEVLEVVIGEATDLFPRGGNIERLGEVAIGNLVADSMRWRYETDIAFTNGGGLRAPLPGYDVTDPALRRPPDDPAPWDVVIGDSFEVLPFGNSVVTRQITGATLHAILEHGVAAIPAANGRFPQVSGFSFEFDSSQPVGSRVVSVTLDDGTPVPADSTTYSLATNDFVNAGGDGYTMLADGGGVTRELMADVLVEYIQHLGTITPVIEGRITDTGP